MKVYEVVEIHYKTAFSSLHKSPFLFIISFHIMENERNGIYLDIKYAPRYKR